MDVRRDAGLRSGDCASLRLELEELRERCWQLTECLRELTTYADDPLVPREILEMLAPGPRRTFAALRAARGRVLSWEALLAALCWDRRDADRPGIKIVQVHVSRLRTTFREHRVPFEIHTIHGTGCYLVEAGAGVAPECSSAPPPPAPAP